MEKEKNTYTHTAINFCSAIHLHGRIPVTRNDY